MSHQRILQALMGLGLSEIDSEIYVFLAKNGPQEIKNIAEALKLLEKELINIINELEKKRIINVTTEQPIRFSAIPFEHALDLLIMNNRKEAQRIEKQKQDLLSDWNNQINKERKFNCKN